MSRGRICTMGCCNRLAWDVSDLWKMDSRLRGNDGLVCPVVLDPLNARTSSKAAQTMGRHRAYVYPLARHRSCGHVFKPPVVIPAQAGVQFESPLRRAPTQLHTCNHTTNPLTVIPAQAGIHFGWSRRHANNQAHPFKRISAPTTFPAHATIPPQAPLAPHRHKPT